MIISYNSTLSGQGKQVGVSGGFRGSSLLTEQTIDFIINYSTDTLINGSYQSQNPKDSGTFHISRQLQIS